MARKNTFAMKNIKDWPRLFQKLPPRQQQAVYMTLACSLVFLMVIIASTIMVFGGDGEDQTDPSGVTNSTVSNVDGGYDKDAGTIDADKYAGVVLPQSTDAGQAYLDETLFIGDSNTVRLHDVYNLVPLKNYMGMVGMTIQGAVGAQCVFFENDVTVYTIPKAIAKVQPRRILMCFGTNNADGNTSTEAFIKHYKAAIKEIQAAYEYADLIVTAIPPCGQERDYPNVSQKTIDEFNKALVSMCESLGLKFLNTAEVLKDSATGYIKTSYISGDGLHLNDAGDKAWIEYARTHSYQTEDKRPALKDIPVRQEPPAPVAGAIVAPTCTENGYTPYTLWNGQVDKRNIEKALGHDYKNGVCSRCAAKDPEYKAHTHNYATKGTAVAPTCTKEGYTPYICECKAEEQRDKVGMLNHHYVNGVCDRAGCLTKDPNYTPHTHNFTDTTKPTCATCTEPNPNYKEPHKHTLGAGTPVLATCIMPGYTPYTCACGYTENRDQTSLSSHNFTNGTCSTCGATDPSFTPPPATSSIPTPPPTPSSTVTP